MFQLAPRSRLACASENLNCYPSQLLRKRANMATKKTTPKSKVHPVYKRVSDFVKRYTTLDANELAVVTTWIIHTWFFSPMTTWPAVTPYLYITGAKGSGKSTLGLKVLRYVCRNHQSTIGITGPGVFNIIGEADEETGEIMNTAPTLALDEIDATYSGAKDEPLRQMLNAGYEDGATVPRRGQRYPVYCPKLLIGIDNGHLPETVTDRTIRINVLKATQEQMTTLETLYPWDVNEESAELQQQLRDFAVDNGLVMRDYRPEIIEGYSPREWAIARTLIQVAHAVGNERQIADALADVMRREPELQTGKAPLYRAIFELFLEMDEDCPTGSDRVTSKQIMGKLDQRGVTVPGNSSTGLASVLSEDGIAPDLVRLRDNHPGIPENGQPVQRGYFRHKFDGVFMNYVLKDEEE